MFCENKSIYFHLFISNSLFTLRIYYVIIMHNLNKSGVIVDIGIDYEPNEKDKLIAMELSRYGIQKKRIAIRLDMSETTLQKHYGNDMSNAKSDLHQHCAKNIYNLAHDEDKRVALKANEYILSKICRLDTSLLEDVDHSALLGLKQALDSLVIKKEQEHEY